MKVRAPNTQRYQLLHALTQHAFGTIDDLTRWTDLPDPDDHLDWLRTQEFVAVTQWPNGKPLWHPSTWAERGLRQLRTNEPLYPTWIVAVETGTVDRSALDSAAHSLGRRMVICGPELVPLSKGIRTPELTIPLRAPSEQLAWSQAHDIAIRLRRAAALPARPLGAVTTVRARRAAA